jgi:hypothetical protein
MATNADISWRFSFLLDRIASYAGKGPFNQTVEDRADDLPRK